MSAESSDIDLVLSLETGADDFTRSHLVCLSLLLSLEHC